MATPFPGPRVDVEAPLAGDDRQAVVDLLSATEAADGYPSVSEEARLDLGQETGEPSTRSLLVRGPDDGAPRLSAYGILEHRRGRWTLEVAVDPARRGSGEAERAMLAAACGVVAGNGGSRLAVWLRSGGHGDPSWLAERGFEPTRELLQLRAPLPVEPGPRAPDRPLEVRPFHPGRDEEAWLEVNRRAFAGHPEQGSWTLADIERRERAAWFDPGGFLIHEIDRRIAGFCWTKVHRTPVAGEIYVIGVDPDFQGRGLGRALTLAGLQHLATRGVPEAMLYVEGTNRAALALYRSLGFTEHHRETVYEGPVPAPTAGGAAPGR